MLFQAIDGSYYPVSRIERIGRDPTHYLTKDQRKERFGDSPPSVKIFLTDEQEVSIYCHMLDSLLRLPSHISPALPGTYIVAAGYDLGDFWTLKTPVFAWAVTLHGDVVPVTADGVNDNTDSNHSILMPTGEVIVPCDCQHDDYATWEADRRARLMPQPVEPAPASEASA